jgi:hypothetical protein
VIFHARDLNGPRFDELYIGQHVEAEIIPDKKSKRLAQIRLVQD